MNTIQINKFLSKYQRDNIFKGVFACDKLPSKMNLPAALVVNLAPATSSGTHWISIFIDAYGTAEVFCSFGLKPKQKEILYFLKMHSKNVVYNRTQLQQISSNTCGKYACIYIIYKLRGYSLKSILNIFSKNPFVNDKHINDLYNVSIK